jgi:acyl dehydratase
MPTEPLFLEDIAVGDHFVTGSLTVTTEDIQTFARQFDPQPFHLDAEAATDSLFGGLAASGWHTAALTMRLLVEGFPLARGVIGAGGELAWPRPTRPGDVLTVHGEVLQITPSRSRPDRGMLLVRSETRNQHGEAVQVFTVNIVAWRRPA